MVNSLNIGLMRPTKLKKQDAKNIYISVRALLNSKAIVMIQSDDYYSGCPNPPLGGIFDTINPIDGSIINQKVSVPNRTIIALLKLHSLTNDSLFLNKAIFLGKNYLLTRTVKATLYGTSLTLMPGSYGYNNGNWEPATSEMDLRTQCETVWALVELYSKTQDMDYLTMANNLLKTIGWAYVNIKTNTGLPNWMSGMIFNEFFGDNFPAVTPSWNTFSLGVGDALVNALQKYIMVAGNTSLTDISGNTFTPKAMLDDFKSCLQYLHDNHDLTMPCGLPYPYLHYEYSDPQINGQSIPICTNWDWINHSFSRETWFASDNICWLITAFSGIGLSTIANEYQSKLMSMMIPNMQNYTLWYDRYTFDGSSLPDDLSSSTSVTGYALIIDVILNRINDKIHNNMSFTLDHYQCTSSNKNISGTFTWDSLNKNASIGIEATAIILSSLYYLRLPNKFGTNNCNLKLWR